MCVKLESWSVKKPNAVVDAFLARSAFAPEAEKAAAEVLDDIRRRGDAAVLAAAKRFDGATLKFPSCVFRKGKSRPLRKRFPHA